MGEQLGPSSDELEPVQSVSREVLLTEEPLDTELPPEGVVLRPPVGKERMLCWDSPLGPLPLQALSPALPIQGLVSLLDPPLQAQRPQLPDTGRATIPSTGCFPNCPNPAFSPLPEATRASRSRRFTGGGGVAGAARRGCGGI